MPTGDSGGSAPPTRAARRICPQPTGATIRAERGARRAALLPREVSRRGRAGRSGPAGYLRYLRAALGDAALRAELEAVLAAVVVLRDGAASDRTAHHQERCVQPGRSKSSRKREQAVLKLALFDEPTGALSRR